MEVENLLMENEKISIVIPVYNVEKYLPECIDSVERQTYRNLEILLVDDGSTDSSGRMCDDYAASDMRITVIHKPNGGLSDARNAGLKHVTGKYLAFIDSDDIVDNGYIEKLYCGLQAAAADIAMCRIETFIEEMPPERHCPNNYTNEYHGTDMLLRSYLTGKIRPMAGGKLYRKKIYDRILFPKGKTTEDVYVFAEVLLQCSKLVTVDSAAYYYRQRKNSIQLSPATNTDCIIEAHFHNFDVISKKFPALSELAYERYLYSYMDAMNKNLLCGGPKDKAQQYKKQLRQNWKRMLAGDCCSAERKLALLLSLISSPLYEATYIAHSKRLMEQIK